MKKILLFLTVAAILFATCKKSSSSTSTTPTCSLSVSSLTGTWDFKDAKYKETPSSSIIDIYNDTNFFYTCERDNSTTFNANGTYTFNDAGISCTPSETVSGTWTLSNDTIYTATSGSGYPSPVTNFSCDTLVITYSNYDTAGDAAIFTYVKQ
jgi:Lipocalin-like domain